MGGVLRINNILKMYMGSEELQGIFMRGGQVWKKPLRSMYPSRLVDSTDNVLFIGSSDVGCLMGATWRGNAANNHQWPNVFRTNYTGTMTRPFEGAVRHGMGAIVSYGRVSTPTIIENARSGMYDPEVNPFLSLDDYDTLVIDTSDLTDFAARITGFFGEDVEAIPDYYRYSHMAFPYQYGQSHHQEWMTHEFEIRMELLRLCSQNGVRKLFLMTPWPRLFEHTDPIWGQHTDPREVDAIWYARYFQNLEDSMHYQQDRLNQQIEFEGLTTHVTLVPMHLMIKRIYEDITAGTAPPILNSIRTLFAHNDNLLTTDPLDDTVPKHWYMLNHYGAYAINALWAAIAYKIDPRGYPRSDGLWTVDEASATYFQNLAWDIAQTYGRAGQTRSNPGYIMPKLRSNPTPTQILGDSLIFHAEGLPQGTTPTLRTDVVRHVVAVLEVDRSLLPVGDAPYAFRFAGAGNMGAMCNIRVDAEGRLNFSGGFADSVWGGPETSTALNLRFMNAPAEPTGTVRVFLDLPLPVPGTAIHYGVHNHRLLASDLDASRAGGNIYDYRTKGSVLTPGTLEPTANRIIADTPGIQLLDIIAVDHHMDDYEYQNILRHLSIKYQTENIFEPLTPDMLISYERARTPLDGTMIHSGHSLTDSYTHGGTWPGDFRAMMNDLGYNATPETMNKATIPGAPFHWRWNNPIGEAGSDEFLDPVRHPDRFDGIMLCDANGALNFNQPVDVAATLDYLCRFAANQIVNGAGNEVILWSVWGEITGGFWPYENETFRQYVERLGQGYRYMADYVTWKMKQLYSDLLPEDWRVWVFPGHRWMMRVQDDIAAGLVPGYTNFEDIFRDEVHPNETFEYGLAAFVVTCLSQRNLTQVPNLHLNPLVSPALAQYFYEIAWDIANEYEPVGMGGTVDAEPQFIGGVTPDHLPTWTFSNPAFEPQGETPPDPEDPEDPVDPEDPPPTGEPVMVLERLGLEATDSLLMEPLTAPIPARGPTYVAMMVTFQSQSAYQGTIFSLRNTGGGSASLEMQNRPDINALYVDATQGGDSVYIRQSLPVGTPAFVEVWVDETGCHASGFFGTEQTPTDLPANVIATEFHIGRGLWDNGPVTATYHAIRVYSGVPDATERAAIRTWAEDQVV